MTLSVSFSVVGRGFQFSLQNTKVCHNFTLIVDIEKTVYTLGDIHQQILFATFYENADFKYRVELIQFKGQ